MASNEYLFYLDIFKIQNYFLISFYRIISTNISSKINRYFYLILYIFFLMTIWEKIINQPSVGLTNVYARTSCINSMYNKHLNLEHTFLSMFKKVPSSINNSKVKSNKSTSHRHIDIRANDCTLQFSCHTLGTLYFSQISDIATNLDLGALDLGIEPVVRGKGDRQKGSGDDTGYGGEGQRHRGARHLGILSLMSLLLPRVFRYLHLTLTAQLTWLLPFTWAFAHRERRVATRSVTARLLDREESWTASALKILENATRADLARNSPRLEGRDYERVGRPVCRLRDLRGICDESFRIRAPPRCTSHHHSSRNGNDTNGSIRLEGKPAESRPREQGERTGLQVGTDP